MKKGFSLIELSVVIVVIGILIGGVIIGTSLVKSAQLQGVVVELGQYEDAINDFRMKYKYLPGSMSNATDYWASTADGDGDNILDCGAGVQDCHLVWNHLGNADFIANDYPIISGALVIDQNVPASSVTGAYYFASAAEDRNFYGLTDADNRNAIQLQGINSPTAFSGAIDSKDAFYIDRKIDDGIASEGRVFVANENPSDNDTCVDGDITSASVDYILTEEDSTCIVYYWLEK